MDYKSHKPLWYYYLTIIMVLWHLVVPYVSMFFLNIVIIYGCQTIYQ
jgi:hypothetical protein